MASILGMDIRETFGRNMRKFRLERGLSQEALAERMGVDRAHVSSMERGQQNVTLLTIWQAAQALERKAPEFLDEENVSATMPSREKAPRRRRTKPQSSRQSS
jgi:transcriptional regulator with XRE-family HTH domain